MARELIEKGITHTRWQTVNVTFESAYVDKVIPHSLNPHHPYDVKWEVIDANVPGVIYRGTKAPGSDYIVLRTSAEGQYQLRLYIPAQLEHLVLPANFLEGFAPLVPPWTKAHQHAQTAYKDELISGTPTSGQYATWTDADTLQGTTLISSDNWTPSDASSDALTLTVNSAQYLKINQLVIAQFAVVYPVTAGTQPVNIQGLPFISQSGTARQYPVAISFTDAGIGEFTGLVQVSTQRMLFFTFAGVAVTNNQLSGKTLRGTAIYRATS